jgi:orotidine-5'-phosphate decarboxylase
MGNPTAVGLDTDFSYLPEGMRAGVKTLDGAAGRIVEFNKEIIDAVCDIVPCVKVQIAYYEAYGAAGIRAFESTVRYSREKGLIVIADAKRNDIGSTAKRYADAFLGTSDVGGEKLTTGMRSDFLTVNGYLGFDGVKPFLENCAGGENGIFVLVKTSNPSGGEFQDGIFPDGRTLYETVGDAVKAWGADYTGEYGYSAVGAVVGATYRAQTESLRERLKGVFFLIPGYGAQGGGAGDAAAGFDSRGLGGIVNSSRGILSAHNTEKYRGMRPGKAARLAALEMRADLAEYVKIRV